MRYYLVLLGLPGAGKGTQARKLSEALDWVWISTGEILRRIAREESELGRKVQRIMEAGQLVDDRTVFEVVKHVLEKEHAREGAILDGFPRNPDQARMLENYLRERSHLSGLRAVLLDVPESVVIERLSARRSCPNCGAVYNLLSHPSTGGDRCEVCGTPLIRRADDDPEVIRKRLETFHRLTEPLIAYFRELGQLYTVRADAPEDEVYRALEALIDSWRPDAGLK